MGGTNTAVKISCLLRVVWRGTGARVVPKKSSPAYYGGGNAMSHVEVGRLGLPGRFLSRIPFVLALGYVERRSNILWCSICFQRFRLEGTNIGGSDSGSWAVDSYGFSGRTSSCWYLLENRCLEGTGTALKEWSARSAYFLPVGLCFLGITLEGIHPCVVYLREGNRRSPVAHFPALDRYVYDFYLP